jgi:hypothetical protein
MSAVRRVARRALPLATIALVCVASMWLPREAKAQTVPAPPPPPPVSVPQPVQPALPVVSPLAPYACGTAGSVATLVEERQSGSPSAQIADVAPYLASAFIICGMIPAPTRQTTCQFDTQLSQAASPASQPGLPTTPTPAGMAVDLVKAVEAVIATQTGHSVPVDVADQLSASLSCTTADLTPAPSPAAEASTLGSYELGTAQSSVDAGGSGGLTQSALGGSESPAPAGQPAQLATPPTPSSNSSPTKPVPASFAPGAALTTESSALLGALGATAATLAIWYRRIRPRAANPTEV